MCTMYSLLTFYSEGKVVVLDRTGSGGSAAGGGGRSARWQHTDRHVARSYSYSRDIDRIAQST